MIKILGTYVYTENRRIPLGARDLIKQKCA